ncbi:MAG TPA: hypothetical protein VLG50_05995 [Candidatus Saccharimonadales bacterium]|nr:hypothetical protein [Candidatus Saccharimonadales bacterium]
MLAMYPFHYLFEFCAQQLGLYTYQNYIELCLFVIVTYKSLTWLKSDHTKPLLLYTYAYCALFFTSYYLSCNILFFTMLLCSPAFIIFCMIAHQRQLQKNFVTSSLKYITPKTIPNKNWFEILTRSCLLASYQKKQIICVVQRTDHLETLLHAPYELHLPIQQEITQLLFSSTALDNPTIVWAQDCGIIHSINVTWQKNVTQELLLLNEKNIHHMASTLLTKKTDAFIFLIDATTHKHALWYQGKCLQLLTIDQLLKCGKEIMFIKQSYTDEKKGNHYGQKYTSPQDTDEKNSSTPHDSSHTPPPLH